MPRPAWDTTKIPVGHWFSTSEIAEFLGIKTPLVTARFAPNSPRPAPPDLVCKRVLERGAPTLRIQRVPNREKAGE